MNCILKRFILKRLNKLLDEHKEDMGKARDTVGLWLNRTKAVLSRLESLSDKLADNNVTDEELDQIVNEFQGLIKEW